MGLSLGLGLCLLGLGLGLVGVRKIAKPPFWLKVLQLYTFQDVLQGGRSTLWAGNACSDKLQ